MPVSPAGRPTLVSCLGAVFFPFACFFSRKRTAAGAVSLAVCLISVPLAFFFFAGIFSYSAMSVWAVWSLRSEMKRSGGVFFYPRRSRNMPTPRSPGRHRETGKKTAAGPEETGHL